MSFGTYARRVRDRDLPHRLRHAALRGAVNRYGPVGFRATWSYLSTLGDLRSDGAALLRALVVLEASRAAWLAETADFAARRRADKARHRRSPTAAERLRHTGLRWPGPDQDTVTRPAVGVIWAEYVAVEYPETPPGLAEELAVLDAAVAGRVAAYLSGGVVDRAVLVACLRDLERGLAVLGAPPVDYWAHRYFSRLRVLGELVVGVDRGPR
jgi:hypothetical protein